MKNDKLLDLFIVRTHKLYLFLKALLKFNYYLFVYWIKKLFNNSSFFDFLIID